MSETETEVVLPSLGDIIELHDDSKHMVIGVTRYIDGRPQYLLLSESSLEPKWVSEFILLKALKTVVSTTSTTTTQ